jgi:hypothetical protein
MFQLTNSETEWMVSQNAIPSRQHLGGTLPNVFTESKTGRAGIQNLETNRVQAERKRIIPGISNKFFAIVSGRINLSCSIIYTCYIQQ